MPQRYHEGGKSAKVRGTVKAESLSKIVGASKAAICLVQACGSSPFSLQTPDGVHANVVLLAQSVDGLNRSGGMRNARLLATTTSHAVPTVDK